MIKIKNRKFLKGDEKYGECNNCGVRNSEADIYKVSIHYPYSTKEHVIDLCYSCMQELGVMITKDTI